MCTGLTSLRVRILLPLILLLVSLPGSALAQADLSVGISFSEPPPFEVGGTIDLLVIVHNGGPADAANASVTVAADDGLTFLDALPLGGIPASCVLNGAQEAVCSWANLPAFQVAEIRISMRFDAPGNQLLSATVTSSVADPDPSDNALAGFIPVEEGENGPPQVVQPIANQITTVGSTVEIGLEPVFSAIGPLTFGAASSNTGVATASVSGTTLILAGVGEGAAEITVTASDENGGTADDTFELEVLPQGVVLHIEKTAVDSLGQELGADVLLGEAFFYVIVATNQGPGPATDIEITDALDARLEVLETVSTSNCALVDRALTCMAGTLPRDSSVVIRLKVNPTATGEICNRAFVESKETGDEPANSERICLTARERDVQLAIEKMALDAQGKALVPGADGRAPEVPLHAPLFYKITVTNTGRDRATEVEVHDLLPDDQLRLVGEPTSTKGACATDIDRTIITCDAEALEGGEQMTVTMQVSALLADTEICNTASVQSNEAAADTEEQDVCVVARRQAQLSVVKTVSATDGEVLVNEPFTYTITVKNIGSDPATNVTVEDVLDERLALLETPGSTRGTCRREREFDDVELGVVVRCEAGTLVPGDSLTITLQVQAFNPSDMICNTATARSDEANAASGPEAACVVVRQRALHISKTSNSLKGSNPLIPEVGSVLLGEPFTYTIRVENRGTTEATGVVVTDEFPPGLFLSEFGQECDFVQSMPVFKVRCEVGTLAPGASVEMELVVVPTEVPTDPEGEDLLGSLVCNVATLESNEEGRTEALPVCDWVVGPLEAARQGAIASFVTAFEQLALAEFIAELDFVRTAQLFVVLEPLFAGTQLRTVDGEMIAELEEDAWVAFADPNKYEQWSHRAAVGILPVAEGAEVKTIVVAHPLRAPDGASALLFDTSTHDASLVRGTPPAGGDPLPETVQDSVDPPAAPRRICAILVSGEAYTAEQRIAFDNNLEIFKANLTREKLGPQVHPSCVFTFKNPTYEKLDLELESLLADYDEIYFYYTGHGSEKGLALSDRRYGYDRLADRLLRTTAASVQVVINACNSGAAIAPFKQDERVKDKDVVLLTSAAADKSSYTLYVERFNTREIISGASAFTLNLGLHWGNPAAESDGQPGISLPEAFLRLQQQNPEIRGGRGGEVVLGRMNTLSNPQLFTRKRQRIDGPEAVRFPGGVTVTPNPDQPFVGTVTVEQSGLVLDEDEALLDMLTPEDLARRQQVITFEEDPGQHTSGKQPAFAVDLSFRLLPALDSLDLTKTPGLAFRATADAPWAVYAATAWNPEDSTVTAFDVGVSGAWALALVDSADEVAIEAVPGEAPTAFALHANYPNPFNPQTTIRFDVTAPAHVRLSVFDVLGRKVATLIDQPLPPGTHQAIFDARDLPSGAYYYRMEAAAYQETRRMVLLK